MSQLSRKLNDYYDYEFGLYVCRFLRTLFAKFEDLLLIINKLFPLNVLPSHDVRNEVVVYVRIFNRDVLEEVLQDGKRSLANSSSCKKS